MKIMPIIKNGEGAIFVVNKDYLVDSASGNIFKVSNEVFMGKHLVELMTPTFGEEFTEQVFEEVKRAFSGTDSKIVFTIESENSVKIETTIRLMKGIRECVIVEFRENRASSSFQTNVDGYVKTIYELAIRTGGIGVFYYDLDKYSSEYFEANDIYAEMVGLDSNERGLYKLKDFESAILPLDKEIGDKDLVKTINEFVSGEIDGTTDEILKIRHRKTNETKYFLSSSTIEQRYIDGKPKRMGGIIIDITERVENEKNQTRNAYIDDLTGLPNNRNLYVDMEHQNNGVGLFLDLDDFKKVNDTYGHYVGDQMLKLFGEALKETVKDIGKSQVYRLYGDEFFVFIENETMAIKNTFEQKLSTVIINKLKYQANDIQLVPSVGIAAYEVGMKVDDFIKSADYAMYDIKIHKKRAK